MAQSGHQQSRTRITYITLLVALLMAIVATSCIGDQLQWNTLSVCEDAAQTIAGQSLLVSYCSQADEDRVDLWLVRGLKVTATPVAGLFEVSVLAKHLYRSDRAYSSEEFPVPDDQWVFSKAYDASWFAESIDLAYVYIHVGGNSFQCLGKVLELECVVAVESITLPDDVIDELAVGRNSAHPTTPRLPDTKRVRSPFVGR